MERVTDERSPSSKLGLAVSIAAALAIPIFIVWMLVYDRQNQSEQAVESITEGWGGPQVVSGPMLVIPVRTQADALAGSTQGVAGSGQAGREVSVAPEAAAVTTTLRPERRKRSIYEAVVYDARVRGTARFVLPAELARQGIAADQLDLARAELRFGLSDPRGLSSNPSVAVDRQPLALQPGGGSGGSPGFFAWLDAGPLAARPLTVEFGYAFRGNASVSLAPHGGDTRWTVHSSWPHPSFGGDFLPAARQVRDEGFTARYRVGNLALGRPLVSTPAIGASNLVERRAPPAVAEPPAPARTNTAAVQTASISLMQPVDLYSQVNRATKYGFLFIGFTFLALLMFDVIGGIRISSVEYLLMGAALVLFFVLLLALAEVIGFTPAYLLASAAIAGLNTAYSAAILGSWRRASVIGGLLVGLYAVLYVLLSLEDFSLLIGSLLLFAALAAVMYATRQIDWSARGEQAAA